MAGKKSRMSIQEAEVPISAMIDIVFLLIIFFVVTASIDREIEDERITLACAPHGKPLTKKDPRGVTINVTKKGEINIAMVKLSRRELVSQLLVAADKWGKDIPIIVRGDRNTQHEYIKKVTGAVKDTKKLYRVKFNAEVKNYKN